MWPHFISFAFMLTLFTGDKKNVNNIPDTVGNTAIHELSKDSAGVNYNGVPDWYLRNRVQAHTRLTLDDLKDSSFFSFPKKLPKYDVTVLTRQIKFGDEEPWWQSKVGKLNTRVKAFNAGSNNLAKTIINQLDSLKIKSIVYYRHLEDSEMYAEHPDWACKDVKGNILKTNRGVALSFNSPYRDVVIERIKELASYGADGFYFDEVHIPFRGDFSEYAQKAYRKNYGSNMVDDFKKGDKLKYYEFRNETIKALFDDIRSAVKAEGKNPVLLVSGNSWPTFTDLHMNSAIFHDFTIKSEVSIPLKATITNGAFPMPDNLKSSISPFYLNALLFSYMRDNSDGPPHIWCPRLKSTNQISNVAAGVITLGGIANLDIDARTKNIENFKTCFEWNKTYGQYFKDLVPFSYYGIGLSENERNKYISQPSTAWTNIIVPAYNTFMQLYDAGIPIKFISDASDQSDIQTLKTVFANNTNTDLKAKLGNVTMKGYGVLKNKTPKEIGMESNSPIFCLRESGNNINIGYFINQNNELVMLTSNDFTKDIPKDNDNLTTNMQKLKSNGVEQKTGPVHLYIKKTFIKDASIKDITNKAEVKHSSEDNGYYVFDFNIPQKGLGMYVFSYNP